MSFPPSSSLSLNQSLKSNHYLTSKCDSTRTVPMKVGLCIGQIIIYDNDQTTQTNREMKTHLALNQNQKGAFAYLGCDAFITSLASSSESDSELEDDVSVLNAFFTAVVELKPDAFFTTVFFTTVDSESELELKSSSIFLTTALSESTPRMLGKCRWTGGTLVILETYNRP